MLGVKRLLAEVTNVSKKAYRYHFETATASHLHPMRGMDGGTDRVVVTPNFIVVADSATGQIGETSQEQQSRFAERLTKILNYFYYNEPERYSADLMGLVSSAADLSKEQGTCSAAVAAIDRQTGKVGLYHIGDTLNAVFREKDIVMVDGQYQTFYRPVQLGRYQGFTAQRGHVEYYSRKDLKDHTIALATNGLWNNVDLNQLHHQIRGPGSFKPIKKLSDEAVGVEEKPQPRSLQEIANQVCGLGAFYGRQAHYESPFYKRAQKYGLQIAKEGYLDDVTVVLARIARTVHIDD